jgi:hypothetical protein
MSSKSIFLTQSSGDAKSVINPVIGPGNLALIDEMNYNYLTTLDTLYGQFAVNKQYEFIPTGLKLHDNLYVAISNIIDKVTDYRMLIIMTLVRELLDAAYNASKIYGSGLLLAADKVILQQQIQQILSNKNVKNVDTCGATGQLSVTKSFKLAPVYNYYITIYGLPAQGTGFDPIKVKYVTDLLTANNIDPYK